MSRNVLKQAEEGRKKLDETKDLTAEEILEIYGIYKANGKDGLIDAITTAFYFGYNVGTTETGKEPEVVKAEVIGTNETLDLSNGEMEFLKAFRSGSEEVQNIIEKLLLDK